MLPYGRKNPLPFPYSLSSANFAVPSQGKGVIHKRVENRRLSTLLCARGAQPQRPRRPQAAPLPAEVQRKTPRPLGTNTLTQFVSPAQPMLKRLPPGKGEPPARFMSPDQPVQKKEKSRRLTICSLEILF